MTDADLRRARQELPNASPPVWLDQGAAAQICFVPEEEEVEPCVYRNALLALLEHRAVDVVVQVATSVRKKLLVADMDSTLIAQECIDELGDLVGLRSEIVAITKRSVAGEVAFEDALRERVALLRGLDIASVSDVLRRITLMPGAAILAHTMRAHGALTVIASGGFEVFASAVAAWAGFDAAHANRLEVEDGRLTGKLFEPIVDPAGKRDLLCRLRDQNSLSPAETMAVGDGANDIPMLRAAGLSVAFRARAAVEDAADAVIQHGDLTALLYLQGYRRSEFAD